MDHNTVIGITGAGAMGAGIAQVAAMAGHKVVLNDVSAAALEKASNSIAAALQKLQEKGKISSAADVMQRISLVDNIVEMGHCGLIIEAIVENLDVKRSLFAELELATDPDCILASNTSSLSLTSIAASCSRPGRVAGLHFFNPAPVMSLVEIIPAMQTNPFVMPVLKGLMLQWGKTPVYARDTPGFIVNRVARPFYGEALRIFDEGIADMATIDWAMTETGGFRMGPFALMDYIGHDVNYVVTESVFRSFFYDPRYKPSFTQKRLVEAGWLGRKSGRGFYHYENETPIAEPDKDVTKCTEIKERILAMLINEAVDALYMNVASAADLETAMTKGVNYPKGLLQWCDEWGADKCLEKLDSLYHYYHDDRYRASALLRKYAAENKKFV